MHELADRHTAVRPRGGRTYSGTKQLPIQPPRRRLPDGSCYVTKARLEPLPTVQCHSYDILEKEKL